MQQEIQFGFEFRRTVTSGIISAKNRTIKIEEENKRNLYLNECINTRYKRFFNRKYLSKYEKKLIQQQLFMENINIKVDLINRKIKLPKLKWIKMREYRNIKKIDGKFVL